MYKLVCVDIDGTLVDDNNNISEENYKAIMKLKEKGVYFLLTTGRSIHGIRKIVDKLSLDGYMITYSGSMIINCRNGQILESLTMRREDVEFIINEARAKAVSMSVWADNILYTENISADLETYEKLANFIPRKVENILDYVSDNVSKILWIAKPEDIVKYRNEYDECSKDKFALTISLPQFLEFYNKDANKAKAIEILSRKLNIDRSEIVAIGDGFNDVPMLDYCGLSIAMSNAHDEVKKHAHHIAPDNNHSGVAWAINKFVLE